MNNVIHFVIKIIFIYKRQINIGYIIKNKQQ